MVLGFSSSCQREISGSCADFRPALLHLAGERCSGAVAEVAQVWLLGSLSIWLVLPVDRAFCGLPAWCIIKVSVGYRKGTSLITFRFLQQLAVRWVGRNHWMSIEYISEGYCDFTGNC